MSDDIKSRLKSRLEDPPQTADEQPMIVREERTFAITAGELREACEINADHPSAQSFAKGCRDYPDAHVLYVERTDLEALLENKTVHPEVRREGGSTVIRKTLVSRSEAKRDEKHTPSPAESTPVAKQTSTASPPRKR